MTGSERTTLEESRHLAYQRRAKRGESPRWSLGGPPRTGGTMLQQRSIRTISERLFWRNGIWIWSLAPLLLRRRHPSVDVTYQNYAQVLWPLLMKETRSDAHIQANTEERTTAPTVMDCLHGIHWWPGGESSLRPVEYRAVVLAHNVLLGWLLVRGAPFRARFWCVVRRFWARFWCAVCGTPILESILVLGVPFFCLDFGARYVVRRF